ncbi:LysR substrate-binding domain-containing protein [Aliivibrio kagoshimensis]|uniref:LysR substrate-binding domain-containing protein n=1 Tax=Aliivibrio kagoshimensis TaxID=2910230 RepID=UPI003D13A240
MAKYSFPPLQTLLTFECCARLGSFSKAANELCLTPPAITHQIKQLESWLNTTLFTRMHRGIKLTQQGEAFAVEIEEHLTQLKGCLNRFKSKTQSSNITLSLTPALATKWLVSRLGRFWKKHPDIQLRLHHSIDAVDLMSDSADIAIRWGDGNWPGTIAEPLLSGNRKPVMLPNMAETIRDRNAADLEGAILLHEDSYLDWPKWLKLNDVSLDNANQGPQIDDASVLLMAVLAGEGVALGRIAVLEDDLKSGALVSPFNISLPSKERYWLVYPDSAKDNPAIMALRAFLRHEANSQYNDDVKYLADE